MDILLVDDSKTMRQLVKRALRQAGYENLQIGEAGNGAEALGMVQAEQPRLVLSDWNMPEMLGIDLLKQVRGGNCEVPFGFITSESSDDIREAAMSAGAFFITKPFTPESIDAALSPHMSK
ncbi:response regulator [Terriglobus tenax]|uniref:response regulator n=1 Tax=Terriglobus tenax TaxID=1111115 RepID=UPI0021E0A8F6|nr:response regulator [Terriglobus tenax]